MKLSDDIVTKTSRTEVGHTFCYAVYVVVQSFLKVLVSPFIQREKAFTFALESSLFIGEFLFLNLNAVFFA